MHHYLSAAGVGFISIVQGSVRLQIGLCMRGFVMDVSVFTNSISADNGAGVLSAVRKLIVLLMTIRCIMLTGKSVLWGTISISASKVGWMLLLGCLPFWLFKIATLTLCNSVL